MQLSLRSLFCSVLRNNMAARRNLYLALYMTAVVLVLPQKACEILCQYRSLTYV
jgi:hypothetical protein